MSITDTAAQSHTVRPFDPPARVEGGCRKMLPLPPDLTGPDCRFPDAVLRSSPDAYSLPLWQNVSAGAPMSSHSGQISMPFNARSDGERLSGQSNLLWYHVHATLPDRNPFPTWAPVTVLCRRKPHGPIAQQTKRSQPASPDLPSAPLSPSPCPLIIYVPCVRQGRTDMETNIASRPKVSESHFPLLSAMTCPSEITKGGETLGRRYFGPSPILSPRSSPKLGHHENVTSVSASWPVPHCVAPHGCRSNQSQWRYQSAPQFCLFGSSLFLLRIRDPILMRLIRYPDGWNKGVLFRI